MAKEKENKIPDNSEIVVSEERVEKIESSRKQMPVIALRGKVFFPHTFLNFDVGRQISITAVDMAISMDNELFIAPQNSVLIDTPKKTDICTYGVVAKIKQIVRVPQNTIKLKVEGLYRAKIVEFLDTKNYFSAVIEPADYIPIEDKNEEIAYYRLIQATLNKYALSGKRISKEMLLLINELNDINIFMDNVMSVANLREDDLISFLKIDSTIDRAERFDSILKREIAVAEIEKKISDKVKESIEKSQKEFYLREQIKAIKTELGEGEEDGENLIKKIKDKKLPKEIEEKALKEVQRLEKLNPSSPDYSIILNYLDWILELPFNEKTVDTEDLKFAKQVLDEDHFGLEKVKERILEYLAVLHLTKEIKGPILCFVGPPGVGKTSIATSIARALNRKFVRMSLGGVKDEAEIRGHRKTYVGAMPGRIIFGLRNVGSSNPVFLLDEIDKLSSDIHGDPSSALLEVLDPEQNATFRDRFLEVPYDLSSVMFITTANSVDSIPYPLLDRMEIIEIGGYTNEEKLEIAKRYLLPKQIKLNGLTEKKISVSDQAIMSMIENYTMEAGVRNLEREVASVVRKVATKVAIGDRVKKQQITEKNISDYLGVKKYQRDLTLGQDEIGAVNGLAWTSVGGTILTIEVSLMSGKGEILLTGKLGDVMKESARAAISYIRANAKKYDIDMERFEKTDIHIHVPEGATPKDGPSAGITMATAILSAFIGKKVKGDVAMTGEITLRGKVLAIGGLKEKALAGYRRGIKTIIIPTANKKDLEEIPTEVRKQIKFITAEEVDVVFKNAIRW